MNYNSSQQIHALQNLLLKYNTVISSFMKSLYHMDRQATYLIYFDVPVKTLHLPVPQAIQEEAKHQLDMLVWHHKEKHL